MIQKLIVLVLILSGWGCGGNKITPPQPETVQAIKAEVEQMTQGPVELEKTLVIIEKQIADTLGKKPTPQMKNKQSLVKDLGKKMEGLKTGSSELRSVLDHLVSDYASGKISEEEFRKQFDTFKSQAADQSISAEKYIHLLQDDNN